MPPGNALDKVTRTFMLPTKAGRYLNLSRNIVNKNSMAWAGDRFVRLQPRVAALVVQENPVIVGGADGKYASGLTALFRIILRDKRDIIRVPRLEPWRGKIGKIYTVSRRVGCAKVAQFDRLDAAGFHVIPECRQVLPPVKVWNAKQPVTAVRPAGKLVEICHVVRGY